MSDKNGYSYAEVYFGPEEYGLYRKFLVAMMRLNIIGLSDEELEESVDQLEQSRSTVKNLIVLHNEEEVTSFRATMKIFFTEKDFRILDDPEDDSFKKWMSDRHHDIYI